MKIRRVLIANRGEVAVRIMRTAAELGIETVAVYSEDDSSCLHAFRADQAVPLAGTGPVAYLDLDQIMTVAKQTGCDAVHPGYGFLSENAPFARRCAEEGLIFVGPRPDILKTLGNKTSARLLASEVGIPTLPGTGGPTTLDDAQAFLESLGDETAAVIKAIAGGGGRGMRVVRSREELSRAYAQCRSEAQRAFGSPDVYVERLAPRARHIEVQILGDGAGEVTHLWERDCTIQRRHQKLVEIAPSPTLPVAIRAKILVAAKKMAMAVRYDGIGTFEFLVPDENDANAAPFAFLEANPRLQVEHTVTEEITGVDLVAAQFGLAQGASLKELGLLQRDIPSPRGRSMQLRVNTERMQRDGVVVPTSGTLAVFDPPGGAGVRIETAGYTGYRVPPSFDSLLAKVVVSHRSADFAVLAAKALRALGEFRIDGVPTNAGFLQSLLRDQDFLQGCVHTLFVEDHLERLLAATERAPAPMTRQVVAVAKGRVALAQGSVRSAPKPQAAPPAHDIEATDESIGEMEVRSPLQGTVVNLAVTDGGAVYRGQPLVVLSSMKMEHEVSAPAAGIVREIRVALGEIVQQDGILLILTRGEGAAQPPPPSHADASTKIRSELEEVMCVRALTLDAQRPRAVAARHDAGHRTARENIEALVDAGSFVEYGQLVVEARRDGRTLEDLAERTPADGLITGIGTINGDLFGPERSKCAVVSYDYTVAAGTQSRQNHRKHDRIFELAKELRLPVVLFADGGGGRADAPDEQRVSGLRSTVTFRLFGQLSGLVPLVGIASGRCFAGNAALLGCCDVIIATVNSNIGMGGPALIAGGGLGTFRPDEIGPLDVQLANGVVDIAAPDETQAVIVAKKLLSYFQGSIASWEAQDQLALRAAVPEQRTRAYNVRSIIDVLADKATALELRAEFGEAMVTSLMRIEGRPLGVIANNPSHLGGAIGSDAADKAARFMRLCDAFGLPLLFLCDTPGIMVGPKSERSALVRHSSRMFVAGANLNVPFFTVVLRKAYGLGAMAMAGGTFAAPSLVVSWPTGEFAGMGIEGWVTLASRKELDGIALEEERRQRYDSLVAAAYENARALNFASHFEIDDVIDPADTRALLARALEASVSALSRSDERHRTLDTW